MLVVIEHELLIGAGKGPNSMCSQTLIVDNFLDDPQAYRDMALALPYYTVKGQADGGEYKNISVRPTTEHKEKIEAAIGKKIDQDYSFCRFAIYGTLLNAMYHADSGISNYACVVYLNTPDQIPEGSGTAFYQHTGLKMLEVPSEDEVRAKGKSPKRVMKILEDSWNDPNRWKEVERVPMAWNRAIFFKTTRFHSRLPIDAFGNTIQDGRLIFVSFFNIP